LARSAQIALALNETVSIDPTPGLTAIEADDFPFERISDIAERESWRKEINRPIYHVHKWWAQRLGSVFRAVVVGALAPRGTDVMESFRSATRFPGAVVFDPFMGSGTTLGESLKLGCRAIGRDINPVAHFLVRNALEKHSRENIESAFASLAQSVKPDIERYYRCLLPDGTEGTALYYFWTKTLPCPSCSTDVDLLGSRIFARHAYAKRYPKSQSLCPGCGDINEVAYDACEATCDSCELRYNPQHGNTHGKDAVCPACEFRFPIAATARARATPPAHRMYAKLALTKDGGKKYLRIDSFDLNLYQEASDRLDRENDLYPVVKISPGYNTNQVLNYGYSYWHEMFNDRQLLCIGLLARAIRAIPTAEVRDALTCLFSGSLEFNNMFASYKGEGTGAVRHMFYHHILKPERTPLEANLWGTSKSSGSFSGMFRTRLLRALEYAADPFELTTEGAKLHGLSMQIGAECADSFEAFQRGYQLYVSCGDSAKTDIGDGTVDAVITDPPFFDNVNYSQLADFFHVWQRHVLEPDASGTTRSDREVQHQDAEIFASRLSDVFRECHRVLKEHGLLAFSYHHSRGEGWTSVLQALALAEFVVTATVPVKAEMSGAAPKNQAKEPIDLDIIIVCRKSAALQGNRFSLEQAIEHAEHQTRRMVSSGRKLSRNDVRVILMGQLLRAVSQGADPAIAFDDANLEIWIEQLRA